MRTLTNLRLLWILLPVSVAVAQTTPAPMFSTPAGYAIPAGANPRFLAAGDFNGDQISDVAVVNPYAGTVTVLFGTLTGTLTPAAKPKAPPAIIPINPGAMPNRIAAGYFVTASTTLDLAVTNIAANGQGQVCVLIGDGTGNFNPCTSPSAINNTSVGHNPAAIAVSDFDQDGNVDLAVANAADNTVSILFGDGKGNFKANANIPPVPVGNYPAALAPGNFDGYPGLAVANQLDGTVTVVSFVPVFTQTSAGTTLTLTATAYPAFPVMPGLIDPPYPYPAAIAVADFNSDGLPDVAVADQGTGAISVLLGNGRGGFTYAAGSPIAVGAAPMAVVTADFNGDGNPDLAVANYASGNVSVLLGNATGGFTLAAGSPYASGESTLAVAVGDFNGASRASLAAVNELDNTVTVLLNGTAPPITVVSGGSFTSPVSPGSIIAIQGSGFATGAAPPPTSPTSFLLGNDYVTITYNNNVQDILGLTSLTPSQIGAVLPNTNSSNLPGDVSPVPGLATLSVVTPTKVMTTEVEIAPLAPALLSASGTGKGVALATATNGIVYNAAVYTPVPCSSACQPVPVDLSHGGTLTFIATGLNNASSVMVTVGGESVPVTPIAQPNTPGTYQLAAQLNVAPPLRGLVPAVITVVNPQGTVLVSNVVSVLIL
jgi:hypothetical protein